MKRIVSIVLCIMFASKIMSQTAEIMEIQLLSPPENNINFGHGDKNTAIVAIHYYENSQSDIDAIDSTLVNTVANGIKTALEESPMFENADIPVYNLYSDTSMINIDMPKNELDAIAEQAGVGTVIAIEFLDIKAGYVFGRSKKTALFTNVDFTTKINIYDVISGEKIMKFTGKDNVVISATNTDEGFIPAPNAEDARSITAEMVGVDFAKRITPTWETVERLVFFDSYSDNSNKKLQGAYNAATKEHNWASAAQQWIDAISESSTKLRRTQIMYNIALSCEMLQQFDLSLKWLEQAKSLRTRISDTIDEYAEIIKQRIADKKKLDDIFS